ncbi:MAG: hypothetical protein PVS3B3_17360 [Ktedonobacteraceae bacterium]
MAQITNSQLLTAVGKLEERVKHLEDQARSNDASHDRMEAKIETLSDKIGSLDQNIVFWQRIGSFISPMVVGIIVVVIEHLFFH